jgi:hypothetical protein
MRKLDAISGETSDDGSNAPASGAHASHPQAPFPSATELDVMLPEDYRNRY